MSSHQDPTSLVLQLKAYISDSDLAYLLGVPYLVSGEEIAQYYAFCANSTVPRVQIRSQLAVCSRSVGASDGNYTTIGSKLKLRSAAITARIDPGHGRRNYQFPFFHAHLIRRSLIYSNLIQVAAWICATLLMAVR
ncbi:hypothetical protein C8J57DRAFT_1227017 [Mycena rebaudengoi]|nr:hypothetical protein C8J57DRAFT_1227017 [Mycena rebaudengoi]